MALSVLAGSARQAAAQVQPEDELLLPDPISELDVELRGRYVRQWRQTDGTLVLLFNGGFRLDLGRRVLTARDAVVWINSGTSDATGRRVYVLTVYLSEDAEVREPAGTITQDNVLLVSNLRTYGRVVKYHDAHAAELLEDTPLYQHALRDRALIEAGQKPGEPTTEVTRPEEARRPKAERPPRVVRYRLPNIEPAETPDGEPVFVAAGGVYFSQAGGPDAPVLEIQAENAVVFPAEELGSDVFGREVEGEVRSDEQPAPAPAGQEPAPREPPTVEQAGESGRGPLPAQALARRIRAVYLEGDVRLSLGTRFVRADRLFYDFEHDRALILDAVLRAEIPERGIPLYVRAAEARQLSAREFYARDARVTTSEFYTPHYHVGAERVYVRDRTTRDATGEPTGRIAGTYELHQSTVNVGGLPLLYWPYSRGDFEGSETALRRFRTAYSDELGVTAETAWRLFNLIGVEAPPGHDATLELDYYSRRGPGVGIRDDYEREDHFGLFRGYYIHDDGEDNLGPLRNNRPDTNERGRILWRHRHFLPNDWEATFEIAYHSDPNFLESFERSEFNEGKQQETAFYLKRARGNEAIELLANWRLLDFITQTEHLPELTYRRIGDTFSTPFVFYHESRIGAVRYRPDDRRLFDEYRFDNTGRTDVTARADAREEAELPLKLGPLNVVPFATLRGTYWDGAPHYAGGLWRGMGTYGVRGGTSFARVYDGIRSELFDINRMRHIVRPEFGAWWSHSTIRSEDITPFDEGIETIDDFYGGTVALRQVWQTKRGGEGQERTVDLLTLNVEGGFFGNAQQGERSNGYANLLRPEDSRSRNYVAGDLIYRLSDTTSLLYDFNFDLNDRDFDRHDVSLAVERLPRLAYVFGLRHAGDINLDLVGGGFNYKLNEKHIISPRAWFDVDTGEVGEIAVAYVRKLPRWYVGLNFEYDKVFEDFTVSFSLWPEGVPEWTLGSRRFTGLATTTGIRP